MKPEQIAAIDSTFKQTWGPEALMHIDRMFVASRDKNALGQLKVAAKELAQRRDSVPEELAEAWDRALGRQVRESVDRAKRLGT